MTKDTISEISSPSKHSSPSFVKLAMRNMVRKGKQRLLHFGLTASGFLGFIVIIFFALKTFNKNKPFKKNFCLYESLISLILNVTFE